MRTPQPPTHPSPTVSARRAPGVGERSGEARRGAGVTGTRPSNRLTKREPAPKSGCGSLHRHTHAHTRHTPHTHAHTHTHTHTSGPKHPRGVHVHTKAHTHPGPRTHAVYTCTHTRAQARTWLCTCTHTQMYTHTRVCARTPAPSEAAARPVADTRTPEPKGPSGPQRGREGCECRAAAQRVASVRHPSRAPNVSSAHVLRLQRTNQRTDIK